MRKLSWLVLLIVFVSSVQAETPEQRDQRMKWWRDARFGMFIHFGLYSSVGGEFKGQKTNGVGEWIMHDLKIPPKEYEETLVPMFNPAKFDAGKIVGIAKDAGMKYIVITSKHHDGFSLYDSKANDYNVMRTPFKRDIMKELSEATHAQGVTMCWYHSIWDWHHPLAHGQTYPQYAKVMRNQLTELITNYGHIGVLWFDGEWDKEWNDQYGRDLYNYLRAKQPDLIINNRIGKTRAGMT
jgi:alpha-L-fucosidase